VRRALLTVVPPAVILAAALGVAPLVGLRSTQQPIAAVGVLAFGLYAIGLVCVWPGAIAWALGLFAVEYLAGLALRGGRVDLAAPVYAAALFLCGELGWLGMEARDGRRLWPGRGFAIAALALAGAGLGSVLLLAATVRMAGGLLLTGLGVVAAVAVAACLAWLARRSLPWA
jgi:hypothetical protein